MIFLILFALVHHTAASSDECSEISDRGARHILYLLAHVNPLSFNHRIAFHIRSLLAQSDKPISFRLVDLYKIDFEASVSTDDVLGLDAPILDGNATFDVQKEQSKATRGEDGRSFAGDIQTQMGHIGWADVIIFGFPMYWWNAPAILKGWFDRILAYGWAYGRGGDAFSGKKCMRIITSGGYYSDSEMKSYYSWMSLAFDWLGMEHLDDIFLVSVNFAGEKRRDEMLSEVEESLRRVGLL